MAEPAVTLVIEKLRHLLMAESVFFAEVADEVEWMEQELRRMQCFLCDADLKQERDENVKSWGKEIREIAFQAEDVVDTFVQRFGCSNQKTSFKNSIKRYAYIPSELRARYNIIKEIRYIKNKIQDVSDRRSALGIENLHGDSQRRMMPVDERFHERRRLAVYTEDEDIAGFEKDEEKLERLLLGMEKRRVTVSVVGIGGIGKTTLARRVYGSISSRGFGCCIWINLSRERKACEILQEIAGQAMGIGKQEIEGVPLDELEVKLRRFLETRRYLIVLDDLRRTETWDQITAHLPNVNNCSRVLITTRLFDVATSALPCFPPHELQVLSDEQSWELFTKKAFLDRKEAKEVCSGERMVMAKQIVKNCGGLPITVVLMGGLLFGKAHAASSWLRSEEWINQEIADPGRYCMDVLDLSYRDLPTHLKSCFLYLSAFPEGYDINADKLIRLWIAEGFVQKAQGWTLEETAKAYMEELIQRCMLRISTKNIQGRIETCIANNLLHDLAVSNADKAEFFHVCKDIDEALLPLPASARRLAVHRDSAIPTGWIESAQNLRTLLNFRCPLGSFLELRRCKLLKVLDLEGAQIESVPKEIGEMVHIRYLGLRNTKLSRLPSSTSELYNLQTLDTRKTGISFLPNGVWSIRTLRHVNGSWLQAPPSIGGSGKSYLQTLDAVAAGPWIENSLYKLSSLHELRIFQFEADRSYANSLSKTLVKLPQLDTLTIFAGEGPLPIDLLSMLSSHHQLKVLALRGSLARCLDFEALPPSLIKLSLKSTKLALSFWIAVAKLQLLKVLILDKGSYVGSEMPCVAGSFPQLQELSLESLEKLASWKLEKKAMPRLAYLRIDNCPALLELPSGLRHIKSLQVLQLSGMSPAFCKDVRNKDWKNVSNMTLNGSVVK